MLDDLGRTEHERSLLGVVHVDGNGIGAAIGKWLRQHVEKGTDDELVRDEHREWSGELTRLGEDALTQVVRRVAAALTGIWASADRALIEAQMVASAQHVQGPWRYERLDGCGHWLPLEAPERLNELLLDCLRPPVSACGAVP